MGSEPRSLPLKGLVGVGLDSALGGHLRVWRGLAAHLLGGPGYHLLRYSGGGPFAVPLLIFGTLAFFEVTKMT